MRANNLIRLVLCLFCFKINAMEILLVGTTGDYPPLTERSPSGYSGKDIEIIKNFAHDRNLNIKFIDTSWKNLSTDLQNNKFLVAVGGISLNKSRSELFYTSISVGNSFKAAMIRCDDLQKYTSWSKIDVPTNIIIENKGGTNEKFAAENIKSAQLRVVDNNADAINGLLLNPPTANVMFTDNIEISYRHKIDPRLCQAIIPEKFLATQKVFLFAHNDLGLKLQKMFNQWWQQNQYKYTQE